MAHGIDISRLVTGDTILLAVTNDKDVSETVGAF